MHTEGMSSEEYVCLDPSAFMSKVDIKSLLEILKVLSEEANKQNKNFKVTVSMDLKTALIALKDGRFDASEIPAYITEIFRKWEPKNPEEVKEFIFKLIHDTEYSKLIDDILLGFNVQTVGEYVSEQDTKIGQDSIFLEDLRHKFGHTVGKVLFDMLAFSDKLKAKILTFSDVILNMMKQLKITLKKGHSEYKEYIKSKSRAGSQLKFLIYFATPVLIFGLRSFLQAHGLPVEWADLTTTEVTLGVGIIADGQ